MVQIELQEPEEEDRGHGRLVGYQVDRLEAAPGDRPVLGVDNLVHAGVQELEHAGLERR